MTIYDSIGKVYSKSRFPDPRIVDALVKLLDLSRGSAICASQQRFAIADIGAGTGGYSRVLADQGFMLYAVEPSAVMRSQSIPHPQVQWFDGYAENLPLPDSSVDAVICILAIHHFYNLEKAVREMNRVTRKGVFVFLTFDPRVGEKLWLADYFPVYREFDFRAFPPLNDVVELVQTHSQRTVEVSTLMSPHDLTDMFAAAGWRRPEIYLNPEVRASISALALADQKEVDKGVRRLQEDLDNGRWDEKYGEIRKLTEIDAGYRFLCAG